MDINTLNQLALAGAFAGIGLAATGSAIGAGVAGSAAIGAWKRCYAQNKPAPFLLMVLAGAPLTQTIYAFVLMVMMKNKFAAAAAGTPAVATSPVFYALMGAIAGVGFFFSAWYQGRAGAAAADAFGETGKGFANYLTVLGIVETVALFTLVFGLLSL